ncbi:MAG: CrcB family protein [Pseudomonadota bacterium]|nr:CrcB family protein [Pseudomonadota bacterium]
MPIWLAVMLGGAIGALGRHSLNTIIPTPASGFPLATFLVNVLGAFLLACLVEYLALKGYTSLPMKAFLVVGCLGAFTTFSTFTMETFLLLERGDYTLSLIYVSFSIFGTLTSFVSGLWILRFLLT